MCTPGARLDEVWLWWALRSEDAAMGLGWLGLGEVCRGKGAKGTALC